MDSTTGQMKSSTTGLCLTANGLSHQSDITVEACAPEWVSSQAWSFKGGQLQHTPSGRCAQVAYTNELKNELIAKHGISVVLDKCGTETYQVITMRSSRAT